MDTTVRTQSPTAEAIQNWILAWISHEMLIAAEELDPAQSFESLGMSSLMAVTMTGDLADWLGREVDPAIVYDHATVASLAQFLAAADQR